MRAMAVWLMMVLIAIPLAYKWKEDAHKAGRVEMYSEICDRLGVDDEHYVRIGNHIIMPEGIFTPGTPKRRIPPDVCNNCHVGGI